MTEVHAASRRSAPSRRRTTHPAPAAPFRLGDISFLNCAPLRWGLRHGGAREQFALASGPPEWLAEELLAGRLDAGPVSLVRYLRHPDAWELLPGGLAVGSDGPVRSCHLVSRAPLGELDGAVVALSRTSRTTTLLARILLEDALGVRPEYRPAPQHLDSMLATADAAVLIGDEALRLHARPPAGLRVQDTGALWREWTGLPMVFAVWVVRREVARERPERVRAISAALAEAAALARAHPAAVARAAAAESARGSGGPLSEDVLLDYYRVLDYSLGARQLAAVREFAHRAAVRGEVPLADPPPPTAPGGHP
ncbi:MULTISPECIES: menaquinone biosynthesis protein [Streptomyces]|uniref:menaquinone biosynthesis protein n=1 Tax=Streptomyces TaxID=1883 RepID=UPI0029AEDA8D|nr:MULTISPECIES: menaquinone biosynthesis protein [Streptomyces]MDX3091954.1 menaquinone biosynthesis protein [Streptomyces sp. ME12-02E]MDX3334956.1 menaquinone biosynthesis protein [Streptomyces sp. ME02-6978a]MDX3360092.1 menaquinone biosynthesis protein [Streptomyces sp. ME02-6978.2a]